MSLLRGYLANFIKPGVITAATDIKTIDYHSRQNQLSDDSLAIGTETLLFLSEFEDEIEGMIMEWKFFSSVMRLSFLKCWPNFLMETKP